jgi:hypothetical protein
MKTRSLTLITATFFALILCLSFASAASLSTANVVIPTSVEQSVGSFQVAFDLINGGVAADLDWSTSTTSSGAITYSTGSDNIGEATTESMIATITFATSYTGTISGILIANPSGSGDNEEIPFSVTITESTTSEATNFCNYDEDETITNEGDLKVTLSVEEVKGIGEDEDWFTFDEIEVEVDVENDGDWDIEDISVEWGLYDSDNDEWAIELDEVEEFNIDEGDEENLIITFKLDTDTLEFDLDELESDYTLVVRATGDIDDRDSAYDGVKTCAEDSQEVQILLEGDLIILDNIETMSETTGCGSAITVSADAWNIGDSDQEDVYVMIYNTELDLREKVTIGDLDAFDDTSLEVTFTIPEDAKEKIYAFTLEVYDEDNDLFEAEDEESEYSLLFTVEGSCISSIPATVGAVLEDGGKAGKQMIIKATVTNDGTSTAAYTINLEGYEAWATSATADPTLVTVNAGESKEVIITLDVSKEAEGTQSFNVQVLSGSKIVTSQPVEVAIESGIFNFSMGDSWYLWVIGAVNILLILIIIVVAIRVSSE